VSILGDVLSGATCEGGQDADDLIVLRFSFLILLYFDEKILK
jgi:hypothetical protein